MVWNVLKNKLREFPRHHSNLQYINTWRVGALNGTGKLRLCRDTMDRRRCLPPIYWRWYIDKVGTPSLLQTLTGITKTNRFNLIMSISFKSCSIHYSFLHRRWWTYNLLSVYYAVESTYKDTVYNDNPPQPTKKTRMPCVGKSFAIRQKLLEHRVVLFFYIYNIPLATRPWVILQITFRGVFTKNIRFF